MLIQIAQVANKSFLILVMQIFKVLGGIIGLLIINYKLTFFVLLLIPLKYCIINKLTKVKISIFNKILFVIEKIGMWYGDIMNGIEEIKLWNIYKIKKNEYKKLQCERFRLNNKFQVLDQISESSSSILQTLIFNSIYILGVSLIIRNQITIGGLITFIAYSDLVITPISLVMTIQYEIANIKPAFENYFKSEILESIDKIVVLEQGKIVCVDSYENLLKSKKELAEIIRNNYMYRS